MEILEALSNLWSINAILYIILGALVGLLLGVLPGFTPTMGVALAVPFTFAMEPTYGLILLGAIYAGSMYSGSITAILLNIPGNPANIGTILDGAPMAKKGKAQQALYISLIASVIGSVISVIALLFLAPLLADFAVQFGPVETFWVAILGLTVLASLGTIKDLTKGLIGGGIGVLIGTIGIAPATGDPRFTFGLPDLQGGVDLVPALVGLFAFSQSLLYFDDLKTGVLMALDKAKGAFTRSLRLIFGRFKKLTLFSSVLGLIIGVMPGAGGQVASVVTYDQAKRYSKNRDNFGKGIPEGVIAPETANSATFGGSLIPTLTLGVPGSPTAAVLLGGLLVHGLWPGPELFTENADITYTVIVALFFAQFVLLVGGYFGIPLFSQVVKTPKYYLAPVIILLCVFGSFAVRSNMFDVYVMLVLGVLGYFAIKLGIPTVAIVLGVILGPIADGELQRGVLIGEAEGTPFTYFFSSPIALGMVALIVISLVSTIFMEVRKERRNRASQEESDDTNKEVPSLSHYLRSKDSLFAIILVVSSLLVYIFYTSNLPDTSGLLQNFILISFIVLGVCHWFVSRKDPIEPVTIPWFLVIEVSLATLILIVLSENFLGFFLGCFLFMMYLPLRIMKSMEIRLSVNRAFVVFIISLAFTLFMFTSFSLFLEVPFPEFTLF